MENSDMIGVGFSVRLAPLLQYINSDSNRIGQVGRRHEGGGRDIRSGNADKLNPARGKAAWIQQTVKACSDTERSIDPSLDCSSLGCPVSGPLCVVRQYRCAIKSRRLCSMGGSKMSGSVVFEDNNSTEIPRSTSNWRAAITLARSSIGTT